MPTTALSSACWISAAAAAQLHSALAFYTSAWAGVSSGMKRTFFTFLIAAVAVAGLGSAVAADEAKKAVAVLTPASGSKVMGLVTFTKSGDSVKVVANVTGLTPGKHGFHIHEFGDCSAPDATSAGGHYNPTDDPHAGHDADERHMGDLGNIEADASGKATVNLTDKKIDLDKVIGKAVIVHEKADDLKTQPTGDAGGRVACGVIGLAKQ